MDGLCSSGFARVSANGCFATLPSSLFPPRRVTPFGRVAGRFAPKLRGPSSLPSVQCRVTPSNAFDVHVYGGPFMHVTEVTCSSRPVIDDGGQEVTCACR